MTDETAAQGGLNPIAALPVEPDLPETSWLWRRVYTYALTLALVALLAFVIHRLTNPAMLKALGYCLCALIVLESLLYTAGATVTDIVRLVKSVDLHALSFGRRPGDQG